MICGTPEMVFCFELHKQSCFMWKIFSFCFSFVNHPQPWLWCLWMKQGAYWLSFSHRPTSVTHSMATNLHVRLQHRRTTVKPPEMLGSPRSDLQQNRAAERWDFVHSRLDDRLHFSCFHSVHFSSRHPGRGFKPTFPCAVIPSKPVEFCCPARFFWGK